MTHDEAIAACKSADPLWPVGRMESSEQMVAELRIAGDRMLIQSGVMKDWSDRFYALALSLEQSKKKKYGPVEWSDETMRKVHEMCREQS